MLTVNFDYHMFGTDMGTLMLQVSDDGGATWTTPWFISGQQHTSEGDAWTSASVSAKVFGTPAPVSVKLRFFYITDNSGGYMGDASIDNISITDDNGTYTTDFEVDLGDWVNTGGYTWDRNAGGTGSSSTGPAGASVGSYYIYTEASNSGLDSTFILESQSTFDTTYDPIAVSPTEEFIRYQDSLLAFGYVGSTAVIAVYKGTTRVTSFK